MGSKSVWYLCALILPFTLTAHADSFWSDSGIKGAKYQDLLKEMEMFRNQNSDLVTIEDYGTTPENRTLRMLIVRKAGVRATSAMLMSGSTHGNEFLNIEDRLPVELVKKARMSGPVADYIADGGIFLFVPILNPDGYENRKRENSRGVDLNRDWDLPQLKFKGFKELETKLLSNKVEKLHQDLKFKLRITVDYHCCIGALLYPWSFENAPPVPEEDVKRSKAIGEIATRYLPVEVGTTPNILGYSAVGTTKDYYYSTYGAAAFTYEGKYNLEKQYLDKHVSWWEEMVRYIVTTTENTLFAARSGKKTVLPQLGE